MSDIKINWRDELIKLFPETTERTLKENHIWCNQCNGIGLVRVKNHIVGCRECYGKGQIELCECGKERQKIGWSICNDCKTKRDIEVENKRYEKAEKINYADYDGHFLINDIASDDKDYFEEWLYDKIVEGKEYPTYVFCTKKVKILNIDLEKEIERCCEDGYDDMSENLDYEGVNKIQEQIDKWIEKQGVYAYCFEEDYSKVILLDEIIEILKKENGITGEVTD